MQRNGLAWDDLRTVLAVVRGGSLSAAARSLGVNHATVFRRLKAIEARLGVRLFERLPGGYMATAAGLEVRAAAERVEAEVLDLSRRLAGQDLRLEGTVRLTAPDDMMERVLSACLARFRTRYPGIVVEAMIDNRMLSLTHREADVAVRPTAEPPEALVGRRIATVAAAAYADPGCLPVTPAEISPDQLRQLPWIGWEEGGGPASLVGWLSRNGLAGQVVYRVNSMLNQFTACVAGVGVALLPCFLGERHDTLVRVLPPQRDLETGLWLLTHRDLRRTARVRALLDFLYDELRTWRPRFEGPPPEQP